MNVHGADIYADFSGLARLKGAAQAQTDESKRAVAEQIEALFIGMMLKSMRAGSGGDSLVSGGGGIHRDMFDSQIAQHLARGGRLGFADMMLRELGSPTNTAESGDAAALGAPDAGLAPPERNALVTRNLWYGDAARAKWASVPNSPALKPALAMTANDAGRSSVWQSPEAFVSALRPAAERAAQQLGTRPEAVLAVAALETGWGKHMPADGDGTPSNNLFGIKAHGWKGGITRSATLEFENGAFNRRVEPFRSYHSPEDAVADFANFVQSQPRYAGALKVADNPEAFLRALHRAGYATDPNYGDKLVSILNSEPLKPLRLTSVAEDRGDA